MTIPQVMELSKDLLITTLLIGMPTMAVSLVVGLIISIVQTATSIQEQTLSFVPRLLAVGFTMILLMGWSLQLGVDFTVRMLMAAAEVVR